MSNMSLSLLGRLQNDCITLYVVLAASPKNGIPRKTGRAIQMSSSVRLLQLIDVMLYYRAIAIPMFPGHGRRWEYDVYCVFIFTVQWTATKEKMTILWKLHSQNGETEISVTSWRDIAVESSHNAQNCVVLFCFACLDGILFRGERHSFLPWYEL